jgi:plastocyanin
MHASRRSWLGLFFVLMVATLTLAVGSDAGDKDKKDEKNGKKDNNIVLINIKKGKYCKEGEDKQNPVTIFVGQSVVWKNLDPNSHTATSSKNGGDGKPLFDTGALNKKKPASDPIRLDEKLYKGLGGDGGEVKVDYYCTIHGADNMKSHIILKPAPKNPENK